MNLYKITWLDRDHGNCVAWAGTIADAKAKVKAIDAGFETLDDRAWAGIEWKPYDVPVDKAGLLRFLNVCHTRENG